MMIDMNALQFAIDHADRQTLDSILKSNTVPEPTLNQLLFRTVRNFNRKLAQEQFQCLKILLRKKANFKSLQNGKTLLAEAVLQNGYIDLVRFLIQRGVQDQFDEHRKNSLLYAIERIPEDPNLVVELASHSSIISMKYDISPLLHALKLKKYKVAKKLIQQGQVNVNDKNQQGDTALHIIMSQSFKDKNQLFNLIKLLIDSKAKCIFNGSNKMPYQLSNSQEARQYLLENLKTKQKIAKNYEEDEKEEEINDDQLQAIPEADQQEDVRRHKRRPLQRKERPKKLQDKQINRKGLKAKVGQSRSIQSIERVSKTLTRIEDKRRPYLKSPRIDIRERSILSNDSIIKDKSSEREGPRKDSSFDKLGRGKVKELQQVEPAQEVIHFQNVVDSEQYSQQPSQSEQLTVLTNRIAEAFVRQIQIISQINQSKRQQMLQVISQINTLIGQIVCYGSVATGLNVPQSDLDLLSLRNSLENVQRQGLLQNAQFVQQIKFIKQASMPVIKLKGKGIRVDITFHNETHTGIICYDFITKCLMWYPDLKNVTVMLKMLLYKAGLNDVYSGGLPSYGLLIMVLSLEQMLLHQQIKQKNSAARKYLQFLRFYGQQFDFVKKAIKVQTEISPGCLLKLQPSSQFYSQTAKIVVIDPLRGGNVCRGSFKVNQLRKCWHGQLQRLRRLNAQDQYVFNYLYS